MFRIFIKLGWFFKQEKKRYLIASTFLMLANLLDVVPPLLIGLAIDAIFLNTLTTEKLVLFAGGLFIVAVLNYFIMFVWQYKLFGGAFVLENLLRKRLMQHFLKMSPPFYEKNRTGDLMAKSTNDLQAISTTAGFGVLTLLDATTYMLIIILTMGMLVSWKLTFAAIVPLPILAITMKYLGDRIHKHYTIAQDAFGEMNDKVLESVSGVRVIRAYHQEFAEEKDFAERTEDVYQKNIKVEKIDSYFFPVTRTVTGLSYCIALSFGTYLIFQQQISLGELISFNVYLGMLTWPMYAIGELINIMQRGNASLDRVEETLNYKEDVPEPEQPIQTEEPSSIEFKQFTFKYPSSKRLNLQEITLKVRKGETIGIVGKTGSGKTTLIKQLLRDYPIDDNQLIVSGYDIQNYQKRDIRNWVGYVPQDQFLFSRTIRENILFANEDATEEELNKAIRLANLEKDLKFLPDGLDTMVGEKGVALSGGQKQRIAIARALIKDPQVLILDDALSAVDGKTEAKIINNLRNERKGKTTIITTHRLSNVEHAHWILVLEEGKVIQEGTHGNLIKVDGWYKEQYERQRIENLDEMEVEV